MSPLTRDKFIELGISVRTDRLIRWATRQLAAARVREERLHSRGVNAAYLAGVQNLIAAVERAWKEAGGTHDVPPEEEALVLLLRQEATAFRREATLMVKVEFGSSPDLLARYRTGVQTGRLIANLARELEIEVALLREHSTRLAGLGGTEAFIGRGDLLVRKLKQAKENLDATRRALPATAAQRCCDKGVLYDLTRKLVRTGRLEFMGDPKQAAAFSFSGVSRRRGVSTQPRLAEEMVAGRQMLCGPR